MARLPSVAGEPQPSRPFLRDKQPSGTPALSSWRVPALLFEPAGTLELLAAVPPADDTTPGVDVGVDLRFWALAARFALELLAGQRFVPTLRAEGGRYFARWQPILDAPEDRARFAAMRALLESD